MEQDKPRKPELELKDLSPIMEYIKEHHEGNVLSLLNWLDKAIYMLHYLSEGEFTDLERQNTCSILMGIREAVMEIYYNQNGWQYARLD